MRRPERLVVCGFRSWMAGYEFGDIECWETAWRLFQEVLGPKQGRYALAELQFFVRSVRESTQRQIRCFPACCRYVCRDECMALAAIAALQCNDEATAVAALHYLTGVGEKPALERLNEAAHSFAGVLTATGQTLLPIPGCIVEDIASQSCARRQISH
ncbi:hypothetical protein FHS85_004340 [Rhodoligotrophos appendicifer]|uniref:hypothetical protein n=2 Tax=Rhodoligotrophos appendicifer TaxID=987056 RepID=UPI0011854DD1|nr:hypothetical protein [Rhodoligotrophos appendicifer]